jgi:hypothetical protein
MRRLFPFLLLAVLGPLCHGGNFTFAPRDGDQCIVRSHREILTETTGQPNELDISDDVAEETVRLTGTTIRVTRILKSETQTEDGAEVSNPAAALLIDRPLTRVYNRKGQLIRIEGGENVIEAAKTLTPVSLREAAEREFKPAHLQATEASAWRVAGCGWLPGHPVRQDAQWDEEEPEPFTIGGQPGRLHAFLRVSSVQYDGDRPTATVLMFGSTAPGLLKDLRTTPVRDLQEPAVQDFIEWNIADLPLHKVISRVVVDPRTLTLSERERIDVGVDGTPDTLRTRIEHDTMKYEPFSPQVIVR